MATGNEEELLELSQQPDVVIDRNDITRISETELSYNDFYWNYMHKNWPVIITDVSVGWECRRNWTLTKSAHPTDNRDGREVDYHYLKQKVGNICVPVANCSKEYYNSHAKTEMRFYEFLDYLEGNSYGHTDAPNSNTTEILYLKDWHLKSQMPDYNFYQVPKHFAADWLNEQLVTTGQDDYRFVYIGPKDSWTPFHADVFGSYSWSTNIVGCKKWILLPPGEESKLADQLGNQPFRIDELMLQAKNVKFFIIHQKSNEAIFVPSGWYHQVSNLTDAISVNHNWFNACNIGTIWNNLSSNMRQVIAEIDDCRQMDNFDEHCQTMLRASFGINYLDFLKTIEFIAERRLRIADTENNTTADTETSSKCLLFEKYKLNHIHIFHDIQSIRSVLDLMLNDAVVCNSRAILYRRCLQLLAMLNEY